MPRNHPLPRLDELLCRLVDGMMTAEECRELESILTHDASAREAYRLFAAAHIELDAYPREIQTTAPASRQRRFLLPITAAAGITLALSSIFWISQPGPTAGPPPQPRPTSVNRPVLAVASRVDQARWNLPTPPATGATLHPGTVNLTTGTLALDLVDGQRVTIQAPARFELISTREMLLHHGNAALRMESEGPTYIIRVPGGAVVDLGTEISLNVDTKGISEVRVFEGLANASVVDSAGRTREERLLRVGESVRIGQTLERIETDEHAFVRSLPVAPAGHSPAGESYAARVSESQPLAWWRFEQAPGSQFIEPQAGSTPLVLGGSPSLTGPEGARFLLTNDSDAEGFAAPGAAIQGLDTSEGFSLECLIYPTSEKHGTAIAIDEPDLPPPSDIKLAPHVKHPPQRIAIERMGTRGSRIGHIHPDFALRAIMRSPAGYTGGTNTYSAESHLMHRWIHVAFTHDGKHLRLYLDGKLSDEAAASLDFQNAALRPIIGRMQPLPVGETRQWIGGIDEVALYGRVLSKEEISAHAAALER